LIIFRPTFFHRYLSLCAVIAVPQGSGQLPVVGNLCAALTAFHVRVARSVIRQVDALYCMLSDIYNMCKYLFAFTAIHTIA